MNQHRALVSVTTPVYNGERTLGGCIESVLAQTYVDWDLTIVDNCSTDRTPEIAAQYAAKDPRIRVRTNSTFVPVIQNYNNAARSASSDSSYCKIVAADDRLDPECLTKMVSLAEANPSVAIVGALGYGFDGMGHVWTGLPYPITVFRGRDVCRKHFLSGPYFFGTPSSVLYRTELVRSRYNFFNERNLHSDTEVCLEFLQDRDFGFIHQVLSEQGSHAASTTSYSRMMNTYLPNMLYLVRRYGPCYLSQDELNECDRAVMHAYYTFLARQLVERRGETFWHFHRNALRDLGLPLSKRRLAVSFARLALDRSLNPKRTIETLIRKHDESTNATSPK